MDASMDKDYDEEIGWKGVYCTKHGENQEVGNKTRTDSEGEEEFQALPPKSVKFYSESAELNTEQLKALEMKERQKLDDKCKSFTTQWLHSKVKELRIVLLGKTGAGKSSTGNLILGREEFLRSARSTAVTRTVKEGCAYVEGIHVRVMDTPGFCDPKRTHEEIVSEIIKVLDTFSDGIHGFAFVFNAKTHRFTEDQKKILSLFTEDLFGPHFKRCCYLIMTHADGMEKSLNSYIEHELEEGTPFGKIIKDNFENRIIAVENVHESGYFLRAMQIQVVRLFASSSTNATVYTNEIMKEHHHRTLKSVDKDLLTIVPVMEAEFSKCLEDKTYGEIKAMNTSQRREAIQTVVDKVSVHAEKKALTILAKKLDQEAEKVFNSKVSRLTDPEFLAQMKEFIMPILAFAQQVLPKLLSYIVRSLLNVI